MDYDYKQWIQVFLNVPILFINLNNFKLKIMSLNHLILIWTTKLVYYLYSPKFLKYFKNIDTRNE